MTAKLVLFMAKMSTELLLKQTMCRIVAGQRWRLTWMDASLFNWAEHVSPEELRLFNKCNEPKMQAAAAMEEQQAG